MEGPGGGPQPEGSEHTNGRASPPMVRRQADKWKSKKQHDRQVRMDVQSPCGWSTTRMSEWGRKDKRKELSKGSNTPAPCWFQTNFIEYLFCAVDCHAILFKPYTNTMKKLGSERLSYHPLVLWYQSLPRYQHKIISVINHHNFPRFPSFTALMDPVNEESRLFGNIAYALSLSARCWQIH